MALKKVSLPQGWKRIFRTTYIAGLILLGILVIQGETHPVDIEFSLTLALTAPVIYWLALFVAAYVLEGFRGAGKVKTEDLFGHWFGKSPRHGFVILLPFFIVIIGMIIGPDYAAVVLGRFIGSLPDPLAILTGVIIGLSFIHDYRKFIGITIVGGIVFALLNQAIMVSSAQSSNPDLSLADVPYYYYLLNFAVVFWIAHIVNRIKIARQARTST